jgi:two-component system phosphate regulon response regulator PhoB
MVRKAAVVLDGTPRAYTVLVASLVGAGFEILEATTGDEALELAHHNAPQLIVANPLSAGMDSDEFALALSTDPGITKASVVFVGQTHDARAISCIAEGCGVSHILTMPFSREDIGRVLGDVIAAKPNEASWVPRKLDARIRPCREEPDGTSREVPG